VTDRSGAPESTPSAPVIFYLFADRIVPKHAPLVEGTSVPCTEVRMQKGALAVRLLSSAFWSLRQQGVIEIEVARSRPARRMLRRPDLRVSPLKGVERPGLEGAVLAGLEDRESVHDVICRWSEVGSTDPWHDVLAEVMRETVANGLIRGGGARWRGAHEVAGRQRWARTSLRQDRRTRAQVSAAELSWLEFQGREKALHDGLTGQCKRSLVACTERWYA
jgi:hypothetical protein